MNPIKVQKDEYGIKLKFPNRTCKTCRKYPCFEGIDKCSSDMARYGCIYYSEPLIDDNNKSTISS